MGQCFGKTSTKGTKRESQNNRQIELNLRAERYQQKIFFTGHTDTIANIFCTIDDTQSPLNQIPNRSILLIFGYIRKYTLYAQQIDKIPVSIQLLLTEFYGKINFPNHYEFEPNLKFVNKGVKEGVNEIKRKVKSTPYPKGSPSSMTCASSTITTIDGDISYPNHSQFPDIPIPSDSDEQEQGEEVEQQQDLYQSQIEHQINFTNIKPLKVTYHNVNNLSLKWIHLLDNSLSIIFVADLSQILFINNNENKDKLLLKDMERFQCLMFDSMNKYESRIPILVLSGIDKFNAALKIQKYKNEFESEFPSFQYLIDDEKDETMPYHEQALEHIKNQYLMIFDTNLQNGSIHCKCAKKKRLQPQKLFIKTINNINDMNEVQRVWNKLNKALIHGNIMHELRYGGIAM